MEYVPAGAGSYHWKLTDDGGRSHFVTVDDLDSKDWLGDVREAVFDGLGRALSTAAALRHEAGLEFVVAPIAACDGELKHFDLRWFPDPAITVVMAAKGYPGDYKKGTRIEGLEEAAKIDGVEIFHAGTIEKGGAILANGGRVLNVCAMGTTIAEAQARAYQAIDRVNWPDGFCRRDIGWQAVEHERG